MHPRRRTLVALNLLGGTAVLASYAHGFATHPGSAGGLWGGVPDGLRPLYVVSMLLAAAGYFPFTYLIVCRVPPDAAGIAGRFGYGIFPLLYALILIPSALWMPLTFEMLARPGGALWIVIRLALGLVGLGAVGPLAALLTLRPRGPALPFALAVAGLVAFSFHTAVLDALVWPALFAWT